MLIYVTCNVTCSFLCISFSLDTVSSVYLLLRSQMAPSSAIVTSRFHESITRHALRSYLSEFISTFFYVFLVVGSGMSSRQYPFHLSFTCIFVCFCSKDFQKKKIKMELGQFLKPLWWFFSWHMLRMKRIQVASFII